MNPVCTLGVADAEFSLVFIPRKAVVIHTVSALFVFAVHTVPQRIEEHVVEARTGALPGGIVRQYKIFLFGAVKKMLGGCLFSSIR